VPASSCKYTSVSVFLFCPVMLNCTPEPREAHDEEPPLVPSPTGGVRGLSVGPLAAWSASEREPSA